MEKDLVSISDLDREETFELFDLALDLKEKSKSGWCERPLAGKTLAMIFEKPSLRTRVTFEVGMMQLGGHAICLQDSEVQLGRRETVADAARNLERWVDGIMARTFSHEAVVELARWAKIPVINGLTDREHPCQALAFMLTLLERRSNLSGLRMAFVGDGNNVAHSLMLLCPKVEVDCVVCSPQGYKPDPRIVEEARSLAQESGTAIEVMDDPQEAVRGADVIYTDVWTSMGQEAEREQREKVFRPYQVNQALLNRAKEDCLVTHCLPAHRGEEITDEVLDGPHSIAFDEAENRLHIQKAILLKLMS